MKILILTAGTGCSSRFRLPYYLLNLVQAGLIPTVIPFGAETMTGPARFWAQLRRLVVCLTARHYDLVWCEGPLQPQLPVLFRWLPRFVLPGLRVYDLHRDEAKCAGAWVEEAQTWIVTANSPETERKRHHYLPWTVSVPELGATRARDQVGLFAAGCDPDLCAQLEARLGEIRPRIHARRFERDELPAHRFEVEVGSFAVALFPAPQTWPGVAERDLLRCMALAIPVLIAAAHPLACLVVEARCGYMLEDLDAWPARLSELLGNDRLRRELGQNGRAWVAQHRERGQHGEALAQFLVSLISHGRG